ncbi:hypothetical protein [Citromicrobium sp. JLT1363]|uniref:hypothetical protein n=1 Tax=Citromicrobium sp. JLT1363 TaxID=517722 RepID=UPI000225E7ED|nr:hypothetical protein [Citromicrobium sp. JLT1363]
MSAPASKLLRGVAILVALAVTSGCDFLDAGDDAPSAQEMEDRAAISDAPQPPANAPAGLDTDAPAEDEGNASVPDPDTAEAPQEAAPAEGNESEQAARAGDAAPEPDGAENAPTEGASPAAAPEAPAAEDSAPDGAEPSDEAGTAPESEATPAQVEQAATQPDPPEPAAGNTRNKAPLLAPWSTHLLAGIFGLGLGILAAYLSGVLRKRRARPSGDEDEANDDRSADAFVPKEVYDTLKTERDQQAKTITALQLAVDKLGAGREPDNRAPPSANAGIKTLGSGAPRSEQSEAPRGHAGTSAFAFRDSAEIRDLVRRFNEAEKRRDYDALRQEYHARPYSNDRTRDLSKIFEDNSDRFWLIANPANPNEAVLIPGFASEAGWNRMREKTTDHVFAYHFDLRSGGERLVINKPAILQRTSSGDWDLYEKGEISGLK